MDEKAFQNFIMGLLDGIHGEKVGKMEPTYVTDIELMKKLNGEMRNALNELFCQGKIKVGETLNGKYIISHKWNGK